MGARYTNPAAEGARDARWNVPPDPPTFGVIGKFFDPRSEDEEARDVAAYTAAYNAEMLHKLANK